MFKISRAIRIGLIDSNTALTQSELGEFLGVSQATVSKYIGGHISPTLDMAIKIADMFGVKLSEFIKWGEE